MSDGPQFSDIASLAAYGQRAQGLAALREQNRLNEELIESQEAILEIENERLELEQRRGHEAQQRVAAEAASRRLVRDLRLLMTDVSFGLEEEDGILASNPTCHDGIEERTARVRRFAILEAKMAFVTEKSEALTELTDLKELRSLTARLRETIRSGYEQSILEFSPLEFAKSELAELSRWQREVQTYRQKADSFVKIITGWGLKAPGIGKMHVGRHGPSAGVGGLKVPRIGKLQVLKSEFDDFMRAMIGELETLRSVLSPLLMPAGRVPKELVVIRRLLAEPLICQSLEADFQLLHAGTAENQAFNQKLAGASSSLGLLLAQYPKAVETVSIAKVQLASGNFSKAASLIGTLATRYSCLPIQAIGRDLYDVEIHIKELTKSLWPPRRSRLARELRSHYPQARHDSELGSLLRKEERRTRILEYCVVAAFVSAAAILAIFLILIRGTDVKNSIEAQAPKPDEPTSEAASNILLSAPRTSFYSHSKYKEQMALGISFYNQSKYVEAEAEFQQVMAKSTEAFGLESKLALDCRELLALASSARARNSLAVEKELRSVLQIRERTQGIEHEDTLTCRRSLALVLGERYGHEAELEELQKVYGMRLHTLGVQHPATLQSRQDIACAFGILKRHREMLAELQELLPVRERVLGYDHPDTRFTREGINLARLALSVEKPLESN